MPVWVWGVLVCWGVFWLMMIVYVVSVAVVLPVTRGALYVSTPLVGIVAFLDAVPMEAGQVLVDIGCGDGRVLREAGRRYGVRGIGFELNPMAYLCARAACAGRRGIHIRLGDFRRFGLGDADVVFCYLFPDVLRETARKLGKELRSGATVASANFRLPGWVPVRVVKPPHPLHNDPIYIYRLPESVDRGDGQQGSP